MILCRALFTFVKGESASFINMWLLCGFESLNSVVDVGTKFHGNFVRYKLRNSDIIGWDMVWLEGLVGLIDKVDCGHWILVGVKSVDVG